VAAQKRQGANEHAGQGEADAIGGGAVDIADDVGAECNGEDAGGGFGELGACGQLVGDAATAALDRGFKPRRQERDQVVAVGGGGGVRGERQAARADEVEDFAGGAAVEGGGRVGQGLALGDDDRGGELAGRGEQLIAAGARGVGGLVGLGLQ